MTGTHLITYEIFTPFMPQHARDFARAHADVMPCPQVGGSEGSMVGPSLTRHAMSVPLDWLCQRQSIRGGAGTGCDEDPLYDYPGYKLPNMD